MTVATQTSKSINWIDDKNETISLDSNELHTNPLNNKKKYAFDVIDDFTVITNLSHKQKNSLHFEEKEDNGNATFHDSSHMRIVRVSIQKPNRRSQGACFRGNDSYVLYNIHKIIKSTDKYHNNINIRFKTFSSNGLMFMMSQEFPEYRENFFSLSIEDGFMHLRYSQASTSIDIKCNGTKVDDGLEHRVRAFRSDI